MEIRLHPKIPPVFERGFGKMDGLQTYSGLFVLRETPQCMSSPKAKLTAYRKGHVLMTETFATFGEAVIGMKWHIVTANEGYHVLRGLHLLAHPTDTQAADGQRQLALHPRAQRVGRRSVSGSVPLARGQPPLAAAVTAAHGPRRGDRSPRCSRGTDRRRKWCCSPSSGYARTAPGTPRRPDRWGSARWVLSNRRRRRDRVGSAA